MSTASYIDDPRNINGYESCRAGLSDRLREATNDGAVQVFETDAAGLYDAYLDSFPNQELWQYYNCHACRKFIKQYGGLVTIDEGGNINSVFWPESLPMFSALRRIVNRSRVIGVFMSPFPVHDVDGTVRRFKIDRWD